MKERFFIDGKWYKTVIRKDGEFSCDKCAFKENRECEYEEEIPECCFTKREDNKDVYFIEEESNFSHITSSPMQLAKSMVHAGYNKNNEIVYWGISIVGDYIGFPRFDLAIDSTLDWLNQRYNGDENCLVYRSSSIF